MAENFENIDNLAKATQEELESVYGIGGEIANAVFLWFKVPENQKLISELQTLNFSLAIDTKKQTN